MLYTVWYTIVWYHIVVPVPVTIHGTSGIVPVTILRTDPTPTYHSLHPSWMTEKASGPPCLANKVGLDHVAAPSHLQNGVRVFFYAVPGTGFTGVKV